MAEKVTRFKFGLIPLLVVAGGGYATYKIVQSMGLIKDKASKDYAQLSKEPWIANYNKYVTSRMASDGNLCTTRPTNWRGAIEDFESELLKGNLSNINEEKVLGFVKYYLKSKFDFAYMCYMWSVVGHGDFPSKLEWGIDARLDDIAFEHLNIYLASLPDTTILTCKCNSDFQKNERQLMYDNDDGNTSYAEIKKSMYCE